MDGFEDENPFETEPERNHSDTSSSSRVAVSEPPSPLPNPSLPLSSPPLSPSSRRPTFPSQGSHRQPQTYKSDFCCARDQWLHSGEDVEILVVDAVKTSVNSNSPYIAYVIRAGDASAHHRYSEFESLRLNLVKLYPTLIIPPIPSKQTIGDYAIKQAKAKEDAAMIARRKRMLQTFLNRITRHPILSNEHIFHRFLDGEVSWSEVLHSPPLSLLPKNILKAPSHNPTDQSASPAYAALPNPSAAHPLRRPTNDSWTLRYSRTRPMEKVTRRTMKRWSDYAQDHSDLGATLNGFSLNESGQLSTAVEKTGQAIDATYMSTTKLLQEFEQDWAEPLHEYSQFADIIKKLLVYRHQKHVQYEMTQDQLEAKQALSQGRVSSLSSSRVGKPGADDENGTEEGTTDEHDAADAPQPEPSVYLPPHPGPSPVRRRAPGMGFLNALSYTCMTARRNNISKTRETISQLEDALHLVAQDLKYSSSTIQADLDRFQRQKVADMREMAISMARSHRDWCRKNLAAWEEAKAEIAKIPDHPNRTPDDEAHKTARRDSTTTINGR
ncbi:uncharacterized protein B0H18DRAFT_1092886 [Fomitopsis serialis]|uniref:uncharacterized protein n=1 Tax=Fomitopsis serialis TaxID=139415 RepID=UPI002008CF06|nr:uncharacterized protein B0H18DRAFT_1092886 [Neoantrodia serialis]KAH9933326.1 hypothetical protein B0H18DRAFT_1092886 [Neoantrodia serialis]